jgi:hypothetical protein
MPLFIFPLATECSNAPSPLKESQAAWQLEFPGSVTSRVTEHETWFCRDKAACYAAGDKTSDVTNDADHEFSGSTGAQTALSS